MTQHLLKSVLLTLALAGELGVLAAQEPALLSGKLAVRFEESPGFFHYVFPCAAADESPAQFPIGPPAAGPSGPDICWPVWAVRYHKVDGKIVNDPPVNGELNVSVDNVRFTFSDSKPTSQPVDFRPREIVFTHQAGKNFAVIGIGDIAYSFSFAVICPACAASAPVPAEGNTAQLDAEYGLVGASFKQFDLVAKRIDDMAAFVRVGVAPKNQPVPNDPPEAMGLYSDLNRRFAELCPEPARSCVQSYAKYQACKGGNSGGECGDPPACSAFCALTHEALQGLKSGLCTSGKLDSATLVPDWSEIAKKMDAARKARGPIDPGTIHLTKTPAGPPLDFMGKPIEPDNPCSVESGYASAMMRYSTAALMQSSGPALAGGSLAGAPGSAPATSVGGSRVKVDISSAVAAGNLLYQVAPIYPPIAKAARVQGTVVLRGIISTTGEISELSVVGGPPMLISAAMDAVKQWRYSPYRVNGQPVEVETTVNVVFSLDLPATAAPTGPKP